MMANEEAIAGNYPKSTNQEEWAHDGNPAITREINHPGR